MKFVFILYEVFFVLSAVYAYGSGSSSFLFGSYDYEKRSPDLNGNDLGYLTLLVVPSENSGENPFYIKMVKDSGSFLYPLKPGKYEIKEMMLNYKYQNFSLTSIQGFFFDLTNGETAYIGRITLLLESDARGNVTVSASSETNNLTDDISVQSNLRPGSGFTIITNRFLIPGKIYFRGLGLMN